MKLIQNGLREWCEHFGRCVLIFVSQNSLECGDCCTPRHDDDEDYVASAGHLYVLPLGNRSRRDGDGSDDDDAWVAIVESAGTLSWHSRTVAAEFVSHASCRWVCVDCACSIATRWSCGDHASHLP